MAAAVIIIICVFSLVSFCLFGIDKHRAVKHKWRIPEITLFLVSFPGGIGGFSGMIFFHHKTRKWKFRILIPLFALIDILILVFFLWSSNYYHAGNAALAAMRSDSTVSVEKTKTGWLFDGPSEKEALIFYPGAKVDETAYAPLLHTLAEKKMDVYLIHMPLRLAFFGINTANTVCREGGYSHYYIGGHSLGGAMASIYAAEHEKEIDSEILLAAYPTKKTAVDTVLIYGSEDGVLNMDRVKNAKNLITGRCDDYCINGGNHAQFGDYGEQAGDGKPGISLQEQQMKTIEEIERFLDKIQIVNNVEYS